MSNALKYGPFTVKIVVFFFFLACRAHILSTFVKTRSNYGASEVRVLNGHGFNFNIVPSLVWIGCPLI